LKVKASSIACAKEQALKGAKRHVKNRSTFTYGREKGRPEQSQPAENRIRGISVRTESGIGCPSKNCRKGKIEKNGHGEEGDHGVLGLFQTDPNSEANELRRKGLSCTNIKSTHLPREPLGGNG